MPKYRLKCAWQMVALIEVEAPSLEAAIANELDEADLPDEGAYVEGSMVVGEVEEEG